MAEVFDEGDENCVLTQDTPKDRVCPKCGDEMENVLACVHCSKISQMCQCEHPQTEEWWMCEVCGVLLPPHWDQKKKVK